MKVSIVISMHSRDDFNGQSISSSCPSMHMSHSMVAVRSLTLTIISAKALILLETVGVHNPMR